MDEAVAGVAETAGAVTMDSGMDSVVDSEMVGLSVIMPGIML